MKQKDAAGVSVHLTETCVCAVCGFYYRGAQRFFYLLSAFCAESAGCPGDFQSQPGRGDWSPLKAKDGTDTLQHFTGPH